MGVTRTESPIRPPLRAWFRMNSEWVEVAVMSAITDRGCSKNDVQLPNGQHREVTNESLRFDDPNAVPKTRRVEYYRLWPGTDGNRGTWDTGYIDVPADTPEDKMDSAIHEATAAVEWADGLVPIAAGFYAYSDPLDAVSDH